MLIRKTEHGQKSPTSRQPARGSNLLIPICRHRPDRRRPADVFGAAGDHPATRQRASLPGRCVPRHSGHMFVGGHYRSSTGYACLFAGLRDYPRRYRQAAIDQPGGVPEPAALWLAYLVPELLVPWIMVVAQMLVQ